MNQKRSICQGCLSINRNLHEIMEYRDLFVFLLGPSKSCHMSIEVCWECIAMLKRIRRFQDCIQNAELVLQSLQQLDHHTVKSLSLLTYHSKDYYDLLIEHVEGDDKEILCVSKSDECSNNVIVKEEDLKKEIDANEDVEPIYNEESTCVDDSFNENIDVVHSSEIVSKHNKSYSIKKYLNKAEVTESYINIRDVNKYYGKIKLSKDEIDNMMTRNRNDADYVVSPFKCELCFSGFKKAVYLRTHNKEKHSKYKAPYKCTQCKSTFSTKFAMEAHWMQCHEMYLCNLCHFLCRKQVQLTKHLRNVHTFTYTCRTCSSSFGTLREFSLHYIQKHERMICDHCQKTFSTKHAIESHIRCHHTTFKCKDCDKIYNSYHSFDQHLRLSHFDPNLHGSETDKRELSYCVECDKQFPTVYKYKQHLAHSARHTPRKRISVPCPDCGKVFSRKTYMNNHYKLVHIKKNTHHCDVCDKYFITGYSLRKHKEYVHEKILMPRTKMCNLCGRGFTTNRVLVHHMRTHTGEKPHHCTFCTAAFSQITALRTHMRARHKHDS